MCIQIKDGKVSVEGATAFAQKVFAGNEEKINVAIDLAKDCVEVSDPDRCEFAFKLFECTLSAATKRGLDPKKIF